MNFPERFSGDRMTVCIQGLGFVGSAMMLAVASARGEDHSPLYNVIGVDIPNEAGHKKAMTLNDGVFPFENNDKNLQAAMEEAHKDGNIWACTDSDAYQLADVVVVDINLDVKYHTDSTPYLDLSMFKVAMRTLGENIKEDTLVIVETTVPPGTCEKIVYPILKEAMSTRGLDPNRLYVAHSYERVMPGENYFNSIVNFWRVYSGINEESANRCEIFLKSVISTENYPLTRLERTTATEIAKVLENSYRATTIAFMEEWGRFAEAVDVDLFEVINAIRMRPTHSNMRQPGFGVGGYCLTKDPYFAKLAAKDLFSLEGMDFPFSTMAVQTNNKMPLVSLNKIETELRGLESRKILVLGVSYRQDVGDTRYSPTEIFAKEAIDRGAKLVFSDPLVSYWDEMRQEVLQSIPDFHGFDAVVFCVQHYQYREIVFSEKMFDDGTLIFDANDVLTYDQRETINSFKCISLKYIGR